MFIRTRSVRRLWRGPWSLAAAMLLLVSLGTIATPAGATAPARFLGPVLSQRENPDTTFGRDGGFSVGLPNGSDFWMFADSPRYQFIRGKWRLTAFFPGSTAAIGPYTAGKPLTRRLTEVTPGAALRTSNRPTPFLPTPRAYIPDGSGVPCAKYQAHRPAFSVRWPLGVALMPDKTNVLVPYVIVCVLSESQYYPQGWGFALFNYKTQRFTVPATDVIPAQTSGAGIRSQLFGSPIVVGKKVTFFSWVCCGVGSGVYRTTMDATVAALKDRTSYSPQLVPGLPSTYDLHVAPKSKTHSKLTMYMLTNDQGGYALYAASSPTGSWSKVGSGGLPRCDSSPRPCHSMALHPELSPPGRMNVSYHLAGFGPGVATEHPYPHEPLRHVVSASLPCQC